MACRGLAPHHCPDVRKTGGRPVFQNIGAVSAEQFSWRCSLPGRWTDSKPAEWVCARLWWVSVIASAPVAGAGDGPQPHLDRMSRAAIAAVLALEDASIGERLAAFSLASFANREQHAWPGTRLAAARAGLSKSQYLAAREALCARGLIELELAGRGRGRPPVLALRFAVDGPWVEEPINAQLVEAVLSHSRSRGAARLLLATLAAIADERRGISGLPAELIRATAQDIPRMVGTAADLLSPELLRRETTGRPASRSHPVPARRRRRRASGHRAFPSELEPDPRMTVVVGFKPRLELRGRGELHDPTGESARLSFGHGVR